MEHSSSSGARPRAVLLDRKRSTLKVDLEKKRATPGPPLGVSLARRLQQPRRPPQHPVKCSSNVQLGPLAFRRPGMTSPLLRLTRSPLPAARGGVPCHCQEHRRLCGRAREVMRRPQRVYNGQAWPASRPARPCAGRHLSRRSRVRLPEYCGL